MHREDLESAEDSKKMKLFHCTRGICDSGKRHKHFHPCLYGEQTTCFLWAGQPWHSCSVFYNSTSPVIRQKLQPEQPVLAQEDAGRRV